MKKKMLAVICAVFESATVTTGYAEQEDWRGGIRTRGFRNQSKKLNRVSNGELSTLFVPP